MAYSYDATPRNTMRRWAALKLERADWFTHWQDIAQYLLPRNGRFLISDQNRGAKKHNRIYDSSATRSLRTLGAGLMAGATSPARPWFKLKTPDDDLNKSAAVRIWLEEVTQRMRDVFNDSNTYRALHSVYEELGAFGTAADFILPDYEHVIHHTPLTIGEYAIACDANGNVTTLYREFMMTALQLVDTFGYDNVSQTVKNLYDNGSGYDKWIPVMHVVEPRIDRDPRRRDALNMPFRSCYFEQAADKYLRESGFRRFPGVVPRWSLRSGDVYGESPGMDALGDIKQLQHQQLRKGQGIDFKTQPPLQAPVALRGRGVQGQPGGVTYVDSTGPGTGIRSAFEVQLDLNELLGDIQDVRMRISRAFYEDLFLMLANSDRREITAREIAERHEEKLLMLGPVLERLHNELLSPLIDVTFDHMVEAGIVPVPPRELQGMELKVEFISMLAQAQKAAGLASLDRLLGVVASAAAFKPEIVDKLDADKVVDAYADMLGVDPTLIVADDKVAIVRQQRAQQAQVERAAAYAAQAAQIGKTLSDTDTQRPSALTDAADFLSGVGGQ